jgi:hypothetical protein
MKTKFILTLSALLLAGWADAQSGAGGAGAGAGAGSSSGTGGTTANGGGTGTTPGSPVGGTGGATPATRNTTGQSGSASTGAAAAPNGGQLNSSSAATIIPPNTPAPVGSNPNQAGVGNSLILSNNVALNTNALGTNLFPTGRTNFMNPILQSNTPGSKLPGGNP